jgi:putative ABC transport system permease protein
MNDVIRIALRALGRNKMRTILTMLGIMVGIGAVIAAVAIGQGGSSAIQAQLVALGTNLIWIEAGGKNVNGVRTGNGGTKTLTVEDALAIKNEVPEIESVSPSVDGRVQVVYGNENWGTSYRGESPEYLEIRRWDLAEGAPFTEQDVEHATNVCLVGDTVVQTLFPHDDPVGKTIRISNLPFLVAGVMAAKGQSTNGQDQDNFVIIPYTTAMHKLSGHNWLDDLYTSAVSPEAIPAAEAAISRLMRQRHKLLPSQPDDFNIRHPEDSLQAQKSASDTITLMLASIASVSLLVGGIGIMNIMLVSVTERTREIGVRMAVGATEEDVKRQFLIEAMVLSLLGGAFGIVLGIAASVIIARSLGWSVVISPIAVVVAALVSIVVGIFFGYYPAQKAARLDPIEALRYE